MRQIITSSTSLIFLSKVAPEDVIFVKKYDKFIGMVTMDNAKKEYRIVLGNGTQLYGRSKLMETIDDSEQYGYTFYVM